MTGCIPLPLSLIGMLTHKRELGCFGHFSIGGLWLGDLDFTISFLAKCLRDLDNFNVDKSGDLGTDSANSTQPLFKALLDQKAFCKGYLEVKKINIK